MCCMALVPCFSASLMNIEVKYSIIVFPCTIHMTREDVVVSRVVETACIVGEDFPFFGT